MESVSGFGSACPARPLLDIGLGGPSHLQSVGETALEIHVPLKQPTRSLGETLEQKQLKGRFVSC